jgi:chemotaxis protein CheD
VSESGSLAVSVFLQPGELFTGQTGARVKTVLGSCVAITIRDRRLGLAAMAHCLLPEAGAPLEQLPRTEALRFVDTTIQIMFNAFARKGARLGDLEVKLFGGADGLGRYIESKNGVGSRNVEAAQILLAARGLNPVASNVGGSRGRVIEFDTCTGEVCVRQLPRAAAPSKRAR